MLTYFQNFGAVYPFKMKFLQFIIITAFLCGCSKISYEPPNTSDDITDAASSWRYQKPDGVVMPKNLESSLKIQLESHYPVWRDTIDVSVNVTILNLTDSHLPARAKSHLYIYDFQRKIPIYWSHIDLAFAEPVSPGVTGILSIPARTTKDLTIPIAATTWADVHSNEWTDSPFYTFVPTGKYFLRFELDFFDENDRLIGTKASNLVEFTTVMTAPDVIIPDRPT